METWCYAKNRTSFHRRDLLPRFEPRQRVAAREQSRMSPFCRLPWRAYALTYDNVSSLFQIVVTLPLPPPVEGGGFKTLSPGGRGEGEGELETEILRRKLAHMRLRLGTGKKPRGCIRERLAEMTIFQPFRNIYDGLAQIPHIAMTRGFREHVPPSSHFCSLTTTHQFY